MSDRIERTKILLLTTGGTIASVKSPDGLVPGLSGSQLREHLPQISDNIEIDIRELYHIDSTDMSADQWVGIVRAVRENYDAYDGFVIAHGTDTMAYTAAILSYLIQNPDKPVILTGAQKPIGFEITDAKANLQDSIVYAADPLSRGVQIVFAGKVIAGTHARKVRSMSSLAFESINLPVIAEAGSGRITRYIKAPEFYKYDFTAEYGPCRFYDQIDTAVFLLKLTPGMSPALIPAIFENYDAVVIESFGAGGIPDSIEKTLFEELSKYRPEEKILAMTTQVTYEGSHLDTYEVGRRITSAFKILEARDMTLEATIAKLMWILADKKQTWEEIEDRFYTPVALDTLMEH